MVVDCVSNMILQDGQIVDATTVDIPQNAVVIYDVLRVMDSVPLYLEDHSERFFKSFLLSGREKPFADSVFAENILSFIKQFGLKDGNIRCVYSIAESTQFLVYEIKHSYPTAEMYAQGVECGTFQGERSNPNVKQEAAVKTNAYKKIAETGVYEVLLVDMQGNVTEGSKSNTFFVKDGTVITALAEDVLCGITRLQILDIIRELQIPLEERKISLDEIAGFDAAFVSGTSPKVLPIRAIEDRKYDVANPIVKQIAQAYDAQIAQYIQEHK